MHLSSLPALPTRLKPSLTKRLLLLLGALTFVVLGFWLRTSDSIIAYLNIGFFGLCAVVFLIQLHPHSAYLNLTPEGFTFCSLFRKHSVLWRDVESFTPIRIGSSKLVGWTFTNLSKSSGRLVALNQKLTGTDAALPDTYGMRAEDLSELLNHLCAVHADA
jgi:hypothetical protein